MAELIIALVGIAIVTATASLLVVQSAGATNATSVVGEQKAVSSSTAATNNNVSNAVLGSLFSIGEDHLTSFNPINKTYTKVSYEGNRTIMPPDDAATGTINATERGNLTFNLQPNGISLVEGRSLLVTKGGEKATAMLVDLNGVRPHEPRSSIGVALFSTNSTGRLAFLHNMIAIYQVKASPGGEPLLECGNGKVQSFHSEVVVLQLLLSGIRVLNHHSAKKKESIEIATWINFRIAQGVSTTVNELSAKEILRVEIIKDVCMLSLMSSSWDKIYLTDPSFFGEDPSGFAILCYS